MKDNAIVSGIVLMLMGKPVGDGAMDFNVSDEGGRSDLYLSSGEIGSAVEIQRSYLDDLERAIIARVQS